MGAAQIGGYPGMMPQSPGAFPGTAPAGAYPPMMVGNPYPPQVQGFPQPPAYANPQQGFPQPPAYANPQQGFFQPPAYANPQPGFPQPGGYPPAAPQQSGPGDLFAPQGPQQANDEFDDAALEALLKQLTGGAAPGGAAPGMPGGGMMQGPAGPAPSRVGSLSIQPDGSVWDSDSSKGGSLLSAKNITLLGIAAGLAIAAFRLPAHLQGEAAGLLSKLKFW